MCDYSYKSLYELEVTESALEDANQYDNCWIRCQNKKNNIKYTVKCVNFEDYEDQAFKELLQEIYIVQQLSQTDNVVRILDYFILKTTDKSSNNQTLVVLYDYCDETLQEIILFRK